ncbi:hypothetical protein L9F63_014820, partial [Diploptera punctata]
GGGLDGYNLQLWSLAKRRRTTSLKTTANSPEIFKIIIVTPAVKDYVNTFIFIFIYKIYYN